MVKFHTREKNQFCVVLRINRTIPIIPTIHAAGRAMVGNSGVGMAHTVLEKVVVTVFDTSDFSHLAPVFTLLTHVSAVFVADIRPGVAGLTLKLIFRQECHGTFVKSQVRVFVNVSSCGLTLAPGSVTEVPWIYSIPSGNVSFTLRTGSDRPSESMLHALMV